MGGTQVMLLLAAVVAGSMVQWILAYRQSRRFTTAAVELRRRGTLAVGRGGRRYRGGRAYVAIATDPSDRVVGAITLSGWTNFSRPRPLHQLEGLRTSVLSGDRPIDGLSSPERLAAREAGDFARQRARPTSIG